MCKLYEWLSDKDRYVGMFNQEVYEQYDLGFMGLLCIKSVN